MKRRWGANQWVLAIFCVFLAAFAVDYGRQWLNPPKEHAIKTDDPIKLMTPDFKVGQTAPDFTLPDAKGKPRRLSELVKKETLLCFICGCEDCREYQIYLADLLRAMAKQKRPVPEVLSVSTALPASEQAWIRDTKLKTSILYDRKDAQGKSVMDLYKGHPCPRSFGIKPNRTVRWIGSSKGVIQMVEPLSMELADSLGFARPGSKVKGRPPAPLPAHVRRMAPSPPSGYNPALDPAPTMPTAAPRSGKKT